MEDPVVKAAQHAFVDRLRDSSDVSKNTKNAQTIAKKWRVAVSALGPDRYRTEEAVDAALDQRIDVVDQEDGIAYEFKVSGKNAPAEFYKDIVKVIIWNRKHKKKLSKLIFITGESFGRPFLDAAMPRAYIEHLAEEGLTVMVKYVRHNG